MNRCGALFVTKREMVAPPSNTLAGKGFLETRKRVAERFEAFDESRWQDLVDARGKLAGVGPNIEDRLDAQCGQPHEIGRRMLGERNDLESLPIEGLAN